MKPTSRIIALVAVLTSLASTLDAQSISVGLRGSGSFPTGAFSSQDQTAANSALIGGAKSGFGYGLDVGASLSAIGVYASFDHISFDCQTATCRSDGKYTLQGVTVGLKLMSPIDSPLRPFVKGGVTFNDLEGGYGGSSSNTLTTDKAPGYEVGVGAELSLLGIFSFVPQARYVGQNLKAKVPGVSAPSPTGAAVNYYTFDLGFSVHTPFAP